LNKIILLILITTVAFVIAFKLNISPYQKVKSGNDENVLGVNANSNSYGINQIFVFDSQNKVVAGQNYNTEIFNKSANLSFDIVLNNTSEEVVFYICIIKDINAEIQNIDFYFPEDEIFDIVFLDKQSIDKIVYRYVSVKYSFKAILQQKAPSHGKIKVDLIVKYLK